MMKVGALLIGTAFYHVGATECECSGRPEVIDTCDGTAKNNFLETCLCDGVISVNWQNCIYEPGDWVGIYQCKGDRTDFDYQQFTSLDGAAVETGDLAFPKAPPTYTCTCLVAVMNRNATGSTPPYDLIIEGTEFVIPGDQCTNVSIAPATAAPIVNVSSAPTARVIAPTVAPIMLEAPIPVMAATNAPLTPASNYPTLGNVFAPSMNGSIMPVAPVNTSLAGGGSAINKAVPTCAGIDEDPYQYFGNGSFIPCCDSSEQCLDDWDNNTRVYYRCVEPDNCKPSTSNLVPEETPAICTGLNQDPYQLYGNATAVPCCNPRMQCLNNWDGDDRQYFKCQENCSPTETSPPICTYQDQDPFQFFGNGTENKCCPGLGRCLDDWNNVDRYYFRCLKCCADSCPQGQSPSQNSTKLGVKKRDLVNYVAMPGEVGVFVSKSSMARTSGAVQTSMTGFLVGVVIGILQCVVV